MYVYVSVVWSVGEIQSNNWLESGAIKLTCLNAFIAWMLHNSGIQYCRDNDDVDVLLLLLLSLLFILVSKGNYNGGKEEVETVVDYLKCDCSTAGNIECPEHQMSVNRGIYWFWKKSKIQCDHFFSPVGKKQLFEQQFNSFSSMPFWEEICSIFFFKLNFFLYF